MHPMTRRLSSQLQSPKAGWSSRPVVVPKIRGSLSYNNLTLAYLVAVSPRMWFSVSLCCCFLLLAVIACQSQQSICASVKIEILQELTLERQAFEGRMTINNGLTGVALGNISADLTFADRNGNSVR